MRARTLHAYNACLLAYVRYLDAVDKHLLGGRAYAITVLDKGGTAR